MSFFTHVNFFFLSFSNNNDNNRMNDMRKKTRTKSASDLVNLIPPN